MNVHQILTGALNRGDDVFSVGAIDNISFTVRQLLYCILLQIKHKHLFMLFDILSVCRLAQLVRML